MLIMQPFMVFMVSMRKITLNIAGAKYKSLYLRYYRMLKIHEHILTNYTHQILKNVWIQLCI